MPNVRVLLNSFNAGEVTNELYGRVELPQYKSAAQRLRNFIPLPTGGAIKRPGFEYVNTVKNPTIDTRLIPFNFSESQTFVIELGAGYFRFHLNGGTLLNLGIPYEVANSYTADSLRDITYEQSGNIITFCHPSYPVSELNRISNLNWTFAQSSFAPNIAPPPAPTVVANYPTPGTSTSYYYAMTALNSLGYEESYGSNPSIGVTNDLTILGNYNTISWTAIPNAVRYNLYKYQGGVFGYIGQTSGITFRDDNILADTSRTVPIIDPVFTSANNYPSAVGYFQQRRFFAGTNNEPTNIWATQAGSDRNMSYAIPSRDADALRFRVIGQADKIRHIASVQDLILLTASAEWRITSTSGGLTASTLDVKTQSRNGASKTRPVAVNTKLLYEQAQGGHIREMAFEWQTQNYNSRDLCIAASHLFNDYRIKDMAFSRAPYPILWAISTSGKLLSLTYVPDEEILAWASHDSADGDIYESCCTITENNEDSLYVIAKRTVNGFVTRYIERLHIYNNNRALDSSLYRNGSPITTVSGLSHLEGRTVSILGDGAVYPNAVVTGGSVTLSFPASEIAIGLPITAEITTLPTIFQDPTFSKGRVKNINKIWINLKGTGQLYAGPNNAQLTPLKYRTFEAYGTPPNLATGEFELPILPNYNQDGAITVRQIDPLPANILYIAYEVAVGG